MIAIGDIIVSDEVVEKQFVCNLSACKGGCCVEGDSGAPLEINELHEIEKNYRKVKPYLTKEGIESIGESGLYQLDNDDGKMKTSLVEGGACVFAIFEKGIAKCGIEKSFEDGGSDFRKPISCHLYPVRIEKSKDGEFEYVNYEKWDICSPACSLGNELKIPVYQFVKDGLVRKYGDDFYSALEQAVEFGEQE